MFYKYYYLKAEDIIRGLCKTNSNVLDSSWTLKPVKKKNEDEEEKRKTNILDLFRLDIFRKYVERKTRMSIVFENEKKLTNLFFLSKTNNLTWFTIVLI